MEERGGKVPEGPALEDHPVCGGDSGWWLFDGWGWVGGGVHVSIVTYMQGISSTQSQTQPAALTAPKSGSATRVRPCSKPLRRANRAAPRSAPARTRRGPPIRRVRADVCHG